jgi:hypothetical protein
VLEFLPFLLQEMIAIAAIIPKNHCSFFHNLFVLLIGIYLIVLLTIKKRASIKIYHRYHFIKHFFIKRLAVIYLTASSSTNSMTGSFDSKVPAFAINASAIFPTKVCFRPSSVSKYQIPR